MATYTDETRVQILIRRDTPQGRFQDAIYLPVAEFEAMKDEDVEALKDARVAGWLDALEAAKTAPQPAPSKKELEAEALALRSRLHEVSIKLEAATVEEAAVIKGGE